MPPARAPAPMVVSSRSASRRVKAFEELVSVDGEEDVHLGAALALIRSSERLRLSAGNGAGM